MVVELKWGQPPAEALANPTQSSSFYAQVAKALRARPGEWAQVPREFSSEDSAKNTAARIRTGRMSSLPKGHFEVVAYGKDLWLRAVPEEDLPKEDEKGDDPKGSVHPIRRSAPASPAPSMAATIRKWAQDRGMDVPKAGRLPQELIDQYDEAHP